MTKFFFKFKNPYFWLIFTILGQKKIFQKIGLQSTSSSGFPPPCQNSKKSNNQIPRKDGQNLFHRILLTSTTAADWHLKVKDMSAMLV